VKEQPSEDDLKKWHRWFAIDSNNSAWKLASSDARSEAENRQMLFRAYAAAYHWSQVGTPLNDARADLTLARVHSLLGQGEPALHYARRSHDFFESHECEDWDKAFGHAEVAYAAAVLGKADVHARHYTKAKQLGEAIADPEDRKVFLEEFARIPANVS
jgi:hypothetical protein